MFDYSDRVVLITGAASGLGKGCAAHFIEAGATVVLTDRKHKAGEAFAAELGERASYMPLDVTEEARWVELLPDIEQRHGRLDVLVNSAGIGMMGSVEDTSLETFRLIHAINVEGTFLGCKYALPLLRKGAAAAGDAAIINVSSVAGLRGVAKLAAYCSSKGAVRLLSKSVAMHCAEQGDAIRCNSIHPSFIDTPMVQDMINFAPDPERMRKMLIRTSPAKRLGEVEEVARVVLFLASPAASYLNGVELPIDGGTTAR